MPDFIFIWDQRLRGGAGGYRHPVTGRIVPNHTARTALDDYVDNAQDTPTALFNLFRNQQISVADLQLQMRDHIKDVHLNAAITAVGGRDQMTQADWGRVGQLIKGQYGYLDNFAEELAGGLAVTAAVLTRMKMYTEAAVGTHERFMTRRFANAGYDLERSVLDARAKHCTGGGSCIEQAAMGWQSIGDMIPIGARVCLTRDRCLHEFRNSLTGEIVR